MATPMNGSVVKAFNLLAAFKDARDGLSLVEAAERSGMTVPTAHRFLRTLLSTGALDLLPNHRYVIGSALRGIAFADAATNSAAAVLAHHVQQLAAHVRETAHVATLDKDMVRYVAKAETQRSLKIVTQIGTALEAYCTGVGKVLLAHKPGEYVERYLKGGDLIALTPRTLTHPDALVAELRKIREQGYALDDEEFETGLRCVAAPVRVNGSTIAALSCSGPTTRFTDEVLASHILTTVRRAQLIGQELERKHLYRIS
ncbi:IclR family transcriptional regulator [Georhizobium profundi]|jgi:DNA-binding IclR family transcriptional regulator|nr:IclR family transcriptional regulator [Georhizobium profundi]